MSNWKPNIWKRHGRLLAVVRPRESWGRRRVPSRGTKEQRQMLELCKRVARNTRRRPRGWLVRPRAFEFARKLRNSHASPAEERRPAKLPASLRRSAIDLRRWLDGYSHETPTIGKIALVNVLLVVRSAFGSLRVYSD